MGWGTYALLGDLGNRLDLQTANEKLKRLRKKTLRARVAQTSRDEGQDERIAALEQENDEIKLLLMELMNTLVMRGVMSEQDTAEVLQRVAAVVPDEPEDDDDPLSDLADAVSR